MLLDQFFILGSDLNGCLWMQARKLSILMVQYASHSFQINYISNFDQNNSIFVSSEMLVFMGLKNALMPFYDNQ